MKASRYLTFLSLINKNKSWFKPPSSASATYTASTVATSTASTVTTNSTVVNSSSESAASTNPLLIPDTAEICSNKNDNKLYANIFNKQALTRFLKEFCPTLLSDDLINNEAFVDGSVQSSKVILDFLQNRKTYDGLRQRKRQGNEMKAILTSLDTKLDSLKKKIDETSRIKVNLCKGLSNVITTVKQKKNTFKFRTRSSLGNQRGNNKIWYPL